MLEPQFLTWRARGGQEMRTCFFDSGATMPAGAPIVFVHGVGMDKAFWQPQLAHFAGSRRVIAYDMLGHGGSSVSTESGGLAEYGDQLLALLDRLDLATVDLVGHSMGSLVSLEFALTHPDRVGRLAALNAVFCRTKAQREAVIGRANALLAAGVTAGVEQTLDRWFGNPIPDEMKTVAELVHQALVSTDPIGYPRAYMIFATSDRRHRSRLRNLRMPALFLTGEFDANSTPEMSHAMAARAPLGGAVVIQGQRHMMSLVAPRPVNAELDKFFQSQQILELPTGGGVATPPRWRTPLLNRRS